VTPIADRRLDWDVRNEPKKLAQAGELFQTTGIQVPAKLEEALGKAFATSGDARGCLWALRDPKDSRTFQREKWREWDKLVRSRFKEKDH
jgi:hypothetical protein